MRKRRECVKLAAAVVIPVVVATVLVTVAAGGDGGGSRAAPTTTKVSAGAQAWQQRVEGAFKPLVEKLTDLLPAAADWAAGKTPAADFSATLDRALPEFLKARNAVLALPALDSVPAARVDYLASANLYIAVVDVYRSAVEVGAGPIEGDLDRLARRVRTLADRMYDRGRVAVDPTALTAGESPDVEIRLPAEVPDWAAEGLAADPPLEPGPPPPGQFPERQERRPTEPVSAWTSRVSRLNAPSPAGLAAAIRSGDPGALRELALRYTEAAGRLRAAPDPARGRERGAVAALGLLIYGESARAGRAGAFTTGDAAQRLKGIAERLANVADAVRDPAFGQKRPGFDSSRFGI